MKLDTSQFPPNGSQPDGIASALSGVGFGDIPSQQNDVSLERILRMVEATYSTYTSPIWRAIRWIVTAGSTPRLLRVKEKVLEKVRERNTTRSRLIFRHISMAYSCVSVSSRLYVESSNAALD